MLSVDYGFDTTVKRSGHAACWCAALGGVVQFGGWPPTKHLGNVVRREISSCPLYVLPVTTIARHVHRADQRRRIDAFDAALGSHRQRRLRRLCEIASGLVRCGDEGTSCGHQRKGSLRLGGGVVGEDEGGGVVEERSTSSLSETGSLSITTEEASENSFEYDEGYVSEQEEENADNQSRGSADDASLFSSSSLRSIARYDTGAPQPPLLHTPAGAPDEAVTLAVGDVVVTPITVDALRQMSLETATRIECDASAFPSIVASQDHTSASRSVRTGHVLSTLHNFAKGHGVGYAMDREAPSVQCDTREVRGKHTVRPLRWIKIRPPVAPRSRHGHHLVSCGERLYVIGGSYWAHGNALASSDMLYDVRKRTWQQISSLFPPRFCAALAESNATCAAPCTLRVSPLSAYVVDGATKDAGFTTPSVSASQECRVLYYFGGSNYSHQPTNTLHRLWLPQEELEELPQYGAVPRKQFKGTLVCDVQRECFPDERKRGENSIGRLFYMDGFQDGCPMAPYLRVYDLATGVWVRVCPSPDLVRGQVSLLQFDLVDAQNSSSASREGASVNPPVTRLRRFEVMGGMPARRGKQRRSRMCYSFDAAQQRFDYSHALPVPGLTAHSVVLLPPPDVPTAAPALDSPVAGEEDQRVLADGTTLLSAYQAALTVLREGCGVWSLCCGGNEDWRDAEQNSLGYPVGWLYLFSPRQIPLTEVSRVQMQRLRIQPRVLSKESDELLDELF
ncbi:hypothetical protein JKF63_02603 [Porcisia hertigi]|uniref:Uncharacterized protein n=1 Tax=Porcisia hertigi TaxID=2761500 RepID=A0A836H9T9_9TRYP|nr:hypothetical protein JKF63_02603 [Porcisia hertigi]